MKEQDNSRFFDVSPFIFKKEKPMPLPKVSGGESEQDYVSRCIAAQSGEDKPEDQKAAICYSTYREAKKADGLRDNVEKSALAAGLSRDVAKSVAQDAVHSYFQVQKTLKIRSLAHLVKALAVNMVDQVRKGGKPIGTVSDRKDGKWKKVGEGEWQKQTEGGEDRGKEEPQSMKGTDAKEVKTVKTISSAEAREYKARDEIPDGWYVHGRAGKDNLDTGSVIQMTKDWSVAESYAGKSGSEWMISPKEDSKVIDLTNQAERSEIIDKLKEQYNEGWLRKGQHSDLAKDIEQNIELAREHAEANGDDADEAEENVWEEIESSLNPEDINQSAEFHDSLDAQYWLADTFEPAMVITQDGAITYDPSKMQTVKL